MKNEAVIAAVIALLKGIEVDGETMQHIIEQVGMEDQMKKQLGGPIKMPQAVLDLLAEEIAEAIGNEGADLIEDFEASISYKEIQLDSVDFVSYRLEQTIMNVLESHLDTEE